MNLTASFLEQFAMLSPYHESALLGLLIYLVKKYVLAPGWNVRKFIATDIRQIVTSVLTTASIIYLTPDAIKILDVMGPPAGWERFSDMLDSVPKFLGFFTGVTGGTLGYDALKLLEPLPFFGPIIKKYLGGEEPKP